MRITSSQPFASHSQPASGVITSVHLVSVPSTSTRKGTEAFNPAAVA
ncbi:MAG: hypothetical protein HHJ14_00150 [Cellulomonas sp.]|nr:hypothetical protein [Cellulomonas sp.]NMM15580.1 hypothetical protein [Cellulomonas sp.]NMM29828.1 hypothetical protein [Cellulomonas sp.]